MTHLIQLYAAPIVLKRNILELICDEPVEFNLRLDHGLNGDVREWLTGSDKAI